MKLPNPFKKKAADRFDDWIDQDVLSAYRAQYAAVEAETEPMRRLVGARALVDRLDSQQSLFELGVPFSEKGTKNITLRTNARDAAAVGTGLSATAGSIGGFFGGLAAVAPYISTVTVVTLPVMGIFAGALVGGAVVAATGAMLGGNAIKNYLSIDKITVIGRVRDELQAMTTGLNRIITGIEGTLTLHDIRRAPDMLESVLAASPSLKERFANEATRAVVTGTSDDIGLPAKPRSIAKLTDAL